MPRNLTLARPGAWPGRLLRRGRGVRPALDGFSGVAVEFVQLWLGTQYGRQFDWKDVIANVAGSLLALGISVPLALRLAAADESPADL